MILELVKMLKLNGENFKLIWLLGKHIWMKQEENTGPEKSAWGNIFNVILKHGRHVSYSIAYSLG